MPDLYIPGWIAGSDTIRLDYIVRQHDSDLSFRRNEANGTFTVFQRLQRDNVYAKSVDALDRPEDFEEDDVWEPTAVVSDQGTFIPVHSFGKQVPTVEQVKKWLYEADSWRHNHVEQIRRRNADRKKAKDAALAEVTHEAAERAEHAFRMAGVDTGVIKSFRPVGKRRRSF